MPTPRRRPTPPRGPAPPPPTMPPPAPPPWRFAAHAGLALCDFFGRFSGRKSSIGGGAVALRSRGPDITGGFSKRLML